MKDTPPKNNPAGIPGFTLLEVLLSMAIFILLAGGIYAAVSVATTTSAEVAVARLETERLDALQRFLRRMFSNLPAAATIELRVRQDGRNYITELLITSAPEFSSFTQGSAADLAISALPDSSDSKVLSLTNYNGDEGEAQRLQNAEWIKMLPGLREVKWRFAGSERTGLQETWAPGNGRPGLAELRLITPDGMERTWHFLIPSLGQPGGVK